MSPLLNEIIEGIRQHPKLVIAEDYEVAVQHLSLRSSRFHNGEETLQADDDKFWVSLRVLNRKQPGRAISHFPTREGIHRLVESAFEASRRSSPDPWFRFPLWKRPKDQVEQATELADYSSLYSLLEARPDSLDETYEQWDIETKLYRKTERFQLWNRRQIHSVQFSLLNQAPDKLVWLREERAMTHPLQGRENWLESLLRQATGLRDGKKFFGSGKAGLVLGPVVVTHLLKRIASWFYADLVQGARSPLHWRRGEAIFSQAISIVDDGALAGAPHSVPFDMEGCQTQETVLVDRGGLRDLLYDAYSATRENRLSTGNFLRSQHAMNPRIQASNLFVKPSATSLAELFRSLEDGIFLQTVDSLEPAPGRETEFVLRGSGWRVSGGECSEPVWDISLRFDLFELFRRATTVGRDLTFMGAYGSPSILFEEMPLGNC